MKKNLLDKSYEESSSYRLTISIKNRFNQKIGIGLLWDTWIDQQSKAGLHWNGGQKPDWLQIQEYQFFKKPIKLSMEITAMDFALVFLYDYAGFTSNPKNHNFTQGD